MTSIAQNTPNRTRELLTHLWRGGNVAYWWTPDGPAQFNPKTQQTERTKRTLWFPVASRWPAVPASWSGNVYMGVHSCTGIPAAVSSRTGKNIPPQYLRARTENIAVVNAVFAEFDAKDFGSKDAILSHLDALPLYPSAVIDSGGGFHCYWLIETPRQITDENRHEYRALQAAWVGLVGGDDAAKDMARVLRVPGFHNWKYTPPRVVTFVEFSQKRIFPFEDIAALVADQVHEATTQHRYERTTAGNGRIDALLAHIAPWRADDYQQWVHVGMACKVAAGDDGFAAWDRWSANSPKYDPEVVRRKWEALRPNGSLSAGTLVHLAREDSR